MALRDLPKTQPTFVEQVKSAVRTLKGVPSQLAGLDTSGRVPTAQLGSGTASAYTFLNGAQAYVVPGGVYYFTDTTSGALNTFLGTLSSGGTVQLGPGTFAGDITITNPNLVIGGSGMNVTIFSGSISIQTGNIRLEDVWVMGNGKAYAIKCFKSGGDSPRNMFRKVRTGATSSGSGDGSTNGLYLDGAILGVYEQCQFSFATNAQVYVDTTQATYSTNCHTFDTCTFNGGAYGAFLTDGGDGVSGMSLFRFLGGNIEDNTTSAISCTENTGLHVQGVDFETTQTITNWLNISNTQPAIIENCTFQINNGGTVTRLAQFSGCAGAVFRYNRADDLGTGILSAGAVVVFDENCVQCDSYGNVLWNPGSGRYVNNRGSRWGYTA